LNERGSGQYFKVTLEAEIRPATADDLEALEWMGLYAAHQGIIQATFGAQQRGDALMLLAIAGGFPIAQVWIDFVRHPDRATATLWAVRTFFPLQGRGIGKRMMAAADAAIRARGVSRAELEVDRRNEAARRFYRRLGWRSRGRSAVHNGPPYPDGGTPSMPELVTLYKEL
jgi:ribosomal protein S18 acetylase RimI-like enzyme